MPERVLPHRLLVPVLGLPVRFEAHEPAAITVVADAFSAWRGVEHVPRLVAAVDPARLRIFGANEEDDDDVGPGLAVPVCHWPDSDRVTIRAGPAFGVADAARRDAILYPDRALLGDRHRLRVDFLEPLVLATLAGPQRIPLRAAAVEYGEITLLLAGPPGSGKSTLACAAALAGFRVMADDRVHIQLEPRLRVWGLPGFIQLPASAARFFPGIAAAAPRVGFGDRERIVLNVRELGALPPLPLAQRVGVCVLVPSGGEPRVTPLAADIEPLLLRTQAQETPGESVAEPVHVLSRHGGWQLEVGADPAAAIELLRETLDELLAG